MKAIGLLLCVMAVVCFHASAADTVLITEFMADSSGLFDEDGDETDWIELQNTGLAPVNLAGWHGHSR